MKIEGRLEFLDGLRGIAALAVLAYHLVGRTSLGWLSARGFLGVGIFFVLSGFVITSTLDGKPLSLSFLGRFALRRSIRLDIPYWASIAATIVAASVEARYGVAHRTVTAGQVAAHLVYLQDLLRFPAISDAYWTLCLEVQFYLTLFLLLWMAGRRAPMLMTASIIASTACLAGVFSVPAGFMLTFWWAFGLGAMTFWALTRRVPWLLMWATLLAVIVPVGAHMEWRLVSASTTCLICLCAYRGGLHRWLSGPVAQFFGRTSYSIYLFHPLIGWTVQSIALRFVGQYLALAFGVLAALASSTACYYLIEHPAVALSRQIATDRRKRSELSSPEERTRQAAAARQAAMAAEIRAPARARQDFEEHDRAYSELEAQHQHAQAESARMKAEGAATAETHSWYQQFRRCIEQFPAAETSEEARAARERCNQNPSSAPAEPQPESPDGTRASDRATGAQSAARAAADPAEVLHTQTPAALRESTNAGLKAKAATLEAVLRSSPSDGATFKNAKDALLAVNEELARRGR